MGARELLANCERTAVVSDCGRFRYRLGRRWGDGLPLAYVMLNPSTADAEIDDATIRRCVTFAHAHGFAAIDVVNLYAFRATKPRDLALAGYSVGSENDQHIAEASGNAGSVCLAWGANVAGLERPQIVLPALRRLGVDLQCLHITRSGHPQHPLMLPSTCRLRPFTAEAIQEAICAAS